MVAILGTLKIIFSKYQLFNKMTIFYDGAPIRVEFLDSGL